MATLSFDPFTLSRCAHALPKALPGAADRCSPRLARRQSHALLLERIRQQPPPGGPPAADLLAQERSMVVVDASATAELLLGRPPAAAVAAHVEAHGFDLHAPHLLDIEVLSVIRRLVASADASDQRGEEAIEDLLALPSERCPHDVLLRRAWEHRENFSANHATYLALAEALADDPPPILTADARFARAAKAHTAVAVILVEELG